ncbi:hypothetical protein OAT84_03100 [Gammaproteobacteria bacterium]|nr:hypothetical protein [Gammaproteobacteria bacterium]
MSKIIDYLNVIPGRIPFDPNIHDINEILSLGYFCSTRISDLCATQYETTVATEFPQFSLFQTLSDEDKTNTLQYIEAQFDHLNSEEFSTSFSVNDEYLNTEVDLNYISSILANPPENAKFELCQAANERDGQKISSINDLSFYLQQNGHMDLAIISDMIDNHFPQDRAKDINFTKDFLAYLRAAKFSTSLRKITDIKDISNNEIIPVDMLSQISASGERCNCLYHSVITGIIDYTCDPSTSDAERERVLNPKDGFLKAFNDYYNTSFNGATFIQWIQSTGIDNKPSVYFIQRLLAPVMRSEVHRRNNQLAEPLFLTDSNGGNNDIHGMESDYAAKYLANMFGVQIITHNQRDGITTQSITVPTALIFEDNVPSSICNISDDHFRAPAIHIHGNFVHFTPLSALNFPNLYDDSNLRFEKDEVVAGIIFKADRSQNAEKSIIKQSHPGLYKTIEEISGVYASTSHSSPVNDPIIKVILDSSLSPRHFVEVAHNTSATVLAISTAPNNTQSDSTLAYSQDHEVSKEGKNSAEDYFTDAFNKQLKEFGLNPNLYEASEAKNLNLEELANLRNGIVYYQRILLDVLAMLSIIGIYSVVQHVQVKGYYYKSVQLQAQDKVIPCLRQKPSVENNNILQLTR